MKLIEIHAAITPAGFCMLQRLRVGGQRNFRPAILSYISMIQTLKRIREERFVLKVGIHNK